MATSYIDYTVQRSADTETPYTDSSPGYRMLLTITEVVNASDKGVFVFKAIPGSQDAVFSHIASPVDMETHPLGNPDPEGVWFRLDTLDLVVDNPELANQVLADLDGDLELLANALDNLKNLGNPEDRTAPSSTTATTPSGEQAGDDTNSVSIMFPVPLDSAPSNRVLVGVYPEISFKLSDITVTGFTVTSSVAISAAHTIRWAVAGA